MRRASSKRQVPAVGVPEGVVKHVGRRLAAAIGLCAVAALLIARLVAAAADTPRAVWVWEEDSYRLLDDETFRNDTMAFLRSQRVSTLYLYADEFRGRNVLVQEPDRYRRLITALHGSEFRVYALLGSAPLRTQEYILPEKRAAAVKMFGDVLAYDAASDPAARFDGLNLDIEPYLLDDWSGQKPLRARQYLDLGAEFMRMKKAAGATLAVGPAIPFWFDGIEVEWNGATRPLSAHTQDLYDYVAIMDYRNFAEGRDGIIAHARDEIDHANAAGREVVIGVETLDTTPPKITFFGKTIADLDAQLALVVRAFGADPSFAGFAIHHLAPYRALVAASATGGRSGNLRDRPVRREVLRRHPRGELRATAIRRNRPGAEDRRNAVDDLVRRVELLNLDLHLAHRRAAVVDDHTGDVGERRVLRRRGAQIRDDDAGRDRSRQVAPDRSTRRQQHEPEQRGRATHGAATFRMESRPVAHGPAGSACCAGSRDVPPPAATHLPSRERRTRAIGLAGTVDQAVSRSDGVATTYRLRSVSWTNASCSLPAQNVEAIGQLPLDVLQHRSLARLNSSYGSV